MKRVLLEKVDFSKTLRPLYTATGRIKEVVADRGTFLSAKGVGEPGGTVFQEAISQLYGLAYTAKFSLKLAGKLDFAVSKLECLWLMDSPDTLPRSQWPWQLLVRIPEQVTPGDLAKARKQLLEKKQVDVASVERWIWTEGRSLQVLHVGPYDDLHRTYQRLMTHIKGSHLIPCGPAHEIYLSDPWRVEPAKLKTLVRMSVKAA